MNSGDRWLTVERLYQEAIDRGPEDRASFVARACGDDQSLRQELESLLSYDRTGDGFLKGPAIEAAAALVEVGETSGSIQSGSLVGPYRIVEQIGRGGMGVVYRAEQEQPLRRTVALKIIKPGMDTEQVIARFEAERRALALMDHPNIARVLDAGASSHGRLYFVMELVRGVPVTEYCDSRGLSLRARIELFLPLCHAIQHAHQKGVIHRDIKPSNILVAEFEGKPVLKVIDFGIAKAMQEPLGAVGVHTQIGAIVGTLEYISPEQAGSFGEDIDTRGDVYSLGVVLYELITGTTPLDRATLSNSTQMEIVRRIREEPAPLVTARLADPKRSREVRGDLEWVVMKALEKDRARRYQTVNSLVRDLERYLSGEPVEAAPASVAYRMRKFAARHRAALATSMAFASLLLAGVAITSRMAIRASRAEQESLAVRNFLQDDLLAQASAFTQAGGKPDPDLKVRTALDRAAVRIVGKFERQPEVQAAIRDTIGKTYLDLGLHDQARRQLEGALALHLAAVGRDSPKTVKTEILLARVRFIEGQYPKSEAEYQTALDLSRRVLGPSDPETLRAMTGLALVYRVQGKFEPARDVQSRALAMQTSVLGPDHPDTLISMGNLAIVYYQQGKYSDAEPLYKQALAAQRRVLGPDHPDTLRTMGNLALAYIAQGEWHGAQTILKQTFEIRLRLLGPEHEQTLSSMNNLAGVYFALGEYAEAESLFKRAFDIHARAFGPEHPDTLMYMNNLALAYDEENKDSDAEKLFKRALSARRRVLGPRHPFTLSTASYLAFFYQRRGNYTQSEAYAAEAAAGLRSALGAANPDTLAAEMDLSLAYLSQGNFKSAERLARGALDVFTAKRPDDWRRFLCESLLGRSLALQSKTPEAARLVSGGYRGMLTRKARMRVPDRYYLDLAAQWSIEI